MLIKFALIICTSYMGHMMLPLQYQPNTANDW